MNVKIGSTDSNIDYDVTMMNDSAVILLMVMNYENKLTAMTEMRTKAVSLINTIDNLNVFMKFRFHQIKIHASVKTRAFIRSCIMYNKYQGLLFGIYIHLPCNASHFIRKCFLRVYYRF